jgi:LemA protein
MAKRSIILIVILATCGLLCMSACGSYNTLVDESETVSAQWHQVESQYQRRLDLIPNIVETVKSEAKFEKSTLTDVIAARSKATQVTIDPTNITADNMQQFKAAQSELSSTLSRLMMVTEQYPDLKSNKAFSELRVELEGCENRISVERGKYNDVVKLYNSHIKKLPVSLYASFMGFNEKLYFESDKEASKAPKIQL